MPRRREIGISAGLKHAIDLMKCTPGIRHVFQTIDAKNQSKAMVRKRQSIGAGADSWMRRRNPFQQCRQRIVQCDVIASGALQFSPAGSNLQHGPGDANLRKEISQIGPIDRQLRRKIPVHLTDTIVERRSGVACAVRIGDGIGNRFALIRISDENRDSIDDGISKAMYDPNHLVAALFKCIPMDNASEGDALRGDGGIGMDRDGHGSRILFRLAVTTTWRQRWFEPAVKCAG